MADFQIFFSSLHAFHAFAFLILKWWSTVQGKKVYHSFNIAIFVTNGYNLGIIMAMGDIAVSPLLAILMSLNLEKMFIALVQSKFDHYNYKREFFAENMAIFSNVFALYFNVNQKCTYLQKNMQVLSLKHYLPIVYEKSRLWWILTFWFCYFGPFLREYGHSSHTGTKGRGLKTQRKKLGFFAKTSRQIINHGINKIIWRQALLIHSRVKG